MIRKVIQRFGSKQLSSKQCIELERQYGCNNYAPLPVVLSKGKGVIVWDCEGKEYLDFMAGISSVNQGHCHPRLQKVVMEQINTLTQVARITHHDKLGEVQEYLNKVTGFDKSYFAQGGVDGDETAVLMARRWAYNVKGVPDGQAKVLFPKKTFWGRSIAARAGSDDPLRYSKFGPFGGLGFELIDFDSPTALETALQNDKNICAYLLEPVLAEGGILYPSDDYLSQVRKLCDKYNVLMIIDEVQTGLGRTGKFFGYNWEAGVKPDLVVLGKSLSGGFYPISAVLGKNEVFDQIKPGEMGSTYGGNPLACAIAKEAVQIIIDENLVENSLKMGALLKKGLEKHRNSRFVKEIRGKGLFLALEFGNQAPEGFGWPFALKLLENGMVTRPSQKDMVLRIAPALCINEKQVSQALEIIDRTFTHFEKK